MRIIQSIGDWCGELLHDGWSWCNRLNQQEWLLLLLVGCFLGFLCMRGFGSRKSY